MPEDANGALLIETAAEKAIREQAEENRRQNAYRKVQVFFNGILTFATIVTAGIVLYQNHILASTSQLDQRAWVGITKNHASMNQSIFQFTLEFRNTGKTPALKVRHGEHTIVIRENNREVVEQALRKHIPLLDIRSYGAVPPSGDGSFFVSTDLGNYFEQIEAGKASVIVIGEIYYETFRNTRRTSFCFSFISAKSNTMALCPNGAGNDMN